MITLYYVPGPQPPGAWQGGGADLDVKRLSENAAAVPAVLVLLILVGAAVRFVVAGQDLFADELATYWIVSTRGAEGVVKTVSTTAEISPPLGFLLSWLTTRIDLEPEWVRLPALLAGVATIPLIYALGARALGRGVGLIAAAFATASPFMIYYSAEARGYGVMMAFVLASTLALVLAVEDGRRRWWFAYGAFVALAAYTHYTSIFVLGAQFLWALWAFPSARKPLLIATALAALAYAPWLPSLKGDLDSPTTLILSGLSPFTFDAVTASLGHWLVGFPYSNVLTLQELPGNAGLVLVVAGVVLGAAGLWPMRGRLQLAPRERRMFLLLGVLALATPVGAAIASAISTDILSTRNLAGSWPYMALAVAGLIASGEARIRIAAAVLVTAGLGVGAVSMLSADNQRPEFSSVADYVASGPRGVVVDAASFTPGPLANFDVAGSDPGGEVFRLSIPEQKRVPFNFSDELPDPRDVARRTVAAAGERPITVVFLAGRGLRAAGFDVDSPAREFIADLPPGYEVSEERVFPAFFPLKAVTLERSAGGG